jgi:hypothetical protein
VFRPGRRLFSAASLALLASGLIHLSGFLAGPPPDPAIRGALEHMAAARFDMPGAQPSLLDVFHSLSLTMTVTLVWLGAQNLLVAALDATGALLRPCAWASTLGLGALVALYGYLRIPPPLVVLAVVEALWIAALLGLARSRA